MLPGSSCSLRSELLLYFVKKRNVFVRLPYSIRPFLEKPAELGFVQSHPLPKRSEGWVPRCLWWMWAAQTDGASLHFIYTDRLCRLLEMKPSASKNRRGSRGRS